MVTKVSDKPILVDTYGLVKICLGSPLPVPEFSKVFVTENDYANFLIRLSNYSGPIATQVERLAAAAKPNLTDHWAVMSGLLGLDMIKVVLGKRVEIAKIDYRSMHHVVRLGRKYKIRYSDAYVLTWAWLENATIVGLNPSPDLVRVGQRIGVEIYTLPHLPD